MERLSSTLFLVACDNVLGSLAIFDVLDEIPEGLKIIGKSYLSNPFFFSEILSLFAIYLNIHSTCSEFQIEYWLQTFNVKNWIDVHSEQNTHESNGRIMSERWFDFISLKFYIFVNRKY